MNLFVSRDPLLPWPCKAYIPSIPTVEENKTSFGYPLTIDVGLRIVLLNEVCLTMRSALLWSRGGNHGALISGLCFYKAGLDLTLPSSETGSPDPFTFWGSISYLVEEGCELSTKRVKKRAQHAYYHVFLEVWKHRNLCVFENARPNTSLLLQPVANECTVWGMAGATKLQELLMRSLAPPA